MYPVPDACSQNLNIDLNWILDNIAMLATLLIVFSIGAEHAQLVHFSWYVACSLLF